jgi:hypothetical protein
MYINSSWQFDQKLDYKRSGGTVPGTLFNCQTHGIGREAADCSIKVLCSHRRTPLEKTSAITKKYTANAREHTPITR